MTYYRLDLRNLSFGELWRMGKVTFPIAALLKILRVPLTNRVAVAYPPKILRLDDHELDSEGRRARVQPHLDLLQQAGLTYRFPYRVPLVSPDASSLAVALSSEDGRIVAGIFDTVHRVGTKTRVQTLVSLLTPLREGRVLVTSSGSTGLAAPPDLDDEVVRGGTRRLIERHGQRIGAAISGVQFVPPDKVEKLLEDRERISTEFHVQRGAYVQMTEAEVEKLRGGKSRGRVWQWGQKALAWGIGIAIGLAWSFGGIGGCWTVFGPTPDDEISVEAFLEGVELEPVDCSGLDPEGPLPPTAAPGGGDLTTVVGIFPDAEAAAAALAAARELGEPEGSAAPSVPDAAGSSGEGTAEVATAGDPEPDLGEATATDAPDPEAARPVGDVFLQRVGRTVFYRRTGGDRQDARPVYERWRESASRAFVVGSQGPMGGHGAFVLAWRPGGEGDAALDDYLTAGAGFQLRPPWAPAGDGETAVTPAQANARRTYGRLQEAELDLLAEDWSGPFAFVRLLWQTWTSDPEDWMDQFRKQQEERLQKLEELASGLLSEDPTLDEEVLELYVAWQREVDLPLLDGDDADPFAETPGPDDLPGETAAWRELRERLGPLERSASGPDGIPVVDDPLGAYGSFWGSVQQSDGVQGARMGFADPGVGLPALVRWMCGVGGTEIRFGVSEEAW